MDLYAAEDARLQPGQWKAVRTGIAVQLPPGYEGQVRPRSGLASKHGVTLLNAPGTIDPGYRGEIRVLLVNLGPLPYRVSAGDRVAQLIIAKYASVRWVEVESLGRLKPRCWWVRFYRPLKSLSPIFLLPI